MTIGKELVPATVNMIGNDPNQPVLPLALLVMVQAATAKRAVAVAAMVIAAVGAAAQLWGDGVGLRSKANATLDEVNAKLDRMHQRTLQILTPHTRDSFDGASRSVDEYYWLNE